MMTEPKPPQLPGSYSAALWFTWILATVIIPGGTPYIMGLLKQADLSIASLAGAVAIILHLVAVSELARKDSGLMTFFLVIGGWLLMATSFFAGCVAVLKQTL